MIISHHGCLQQLLNFYPCVLANRILLCFCELLIIPYEIKVFS